MVCKLCKSKNIEKYKRVDKYILIRCRNCHFICLDNTKLLKDEVEKLNLFKYESNESKSFYFSKRNELTKRAVKYADILKIYKIQGRLLDVGCSYGIYSKIFKIYGYNITGIEISKDAVKYSSEKLKLNVVNGDFESYNFHNKSYDIITMFDVIEHFEDPYKVIKKIRFLLNKNGIVIIQTPNIDSLIYKLTNTSWFWLIPGQHISFFSFSRLIKFLEENKFNILHKSTWDDFEEFTNNILYIFRLKNKGVTTPIYYLLKKVIYLLVSLLNRFWNKYYLGGEILLYAQKA